MKFIVFLFPPRGGTFAPSFTACNGIKRDETSCKCSTDGGSNAQRTSIKDYTKKKDAYIPDGYLHLFIVALKSRNT